MMQKNYRRVSWKDHIDKHNLLYSSLYGFREGNSTQRAILDIVNAIQSNMTESRSILVWSLFELKKAFDTVQHNILPDKLNLYGFPGII